MQNWLFSSGGCERTVDIDRRNRVEFDAARVDSYFEELSIAPGIWLYRAEADGKSTFRMEMPEPPRAGRIILGCMLGGAGTIRLDGCEEMMWRPEGRFYALTPTNRGTYYDVRCADRWATVAVRLEGDALEMLSGERGVPQLALDAIGERLVDLARSAPLTPAMRHLAQELLSPTYHGPTGRLYLQARSFELLARQFAVLGDCPDRISLNGPETARIRDARQRLLADLANPPDLFALACSVGMTPKRLNRGFRELFGVTVFEHLRDMRLDAARQALEDEPELPLKQLAWRLGYTETNSFISAFRRRFGVSPGAFRDRRSRFN